MERCLRGLTAAVPVQISTATFQVVLWLRPMHDRVMLSSVSIFDTHTGTLQEQATVGMVSFVYTGCVRTSHQLLQQNLMRYTSCRWYMPHSEQVIPSKTGSDRHVLQKQARLHPAFGLHKSSGTQAARSVPAVQAAVLHNACNQRADLQLGALLEGLLLDPQHPCFSLRYPPLGFQLPLVHCC